MIDSLRDRFRPTKSNASSRRSIWLFAFLSAVVAYVVLLTQYESQIADVETKIADIEGIVSSDALFARAKPHLLARRDRIVEHLRGSLSVDATEADAIGAFLREAHTIAQRNGVGVTSIAQDISPVATPAPVRTPPAIVAAGAPAGGRLAAAAGNARRPVLVPAAADRLRVPSGPRPFDASFVGIPFHLAVSGDYGPILRTIAQLSHAGVLVRVDRIALTPGRIGTSNLNADIRVTVFRPTPTAATLMGASK
jgi:hypothetical protein